MEFIKFSSSLLSALGITMPVLAVAILWIFSWRRTKSSYSVMAKLWKIMHRKDECKDAEINAYMLEQHALMTFRFTTGINARSLKNSKDIIAWSKLHDIGIDTIRACRSFFDVENVGLKEDKYLPNRFTIFGRLVLAFLAAMITVSVLCVAIPSSAWVTMTKTGTQLMVSSDYAHRLFHEGRGIHRQQCIDNETLSDSGFSNDDAQTICSVLKNKDISIYVAKVVRQQRYISLLGSPLLFILFWLLLGDAFSAISAKNVQLRLQQQKNSLAAAQ